MKWFTEKIHRYKIFSTSLYLNLIEKYKVREDFFNIYKACVEAMLRSPEMDSRTKAPGYYWYQKIIFNAERAKNFNPHISVVGVSENIVEVINFFDSLFTIISNCTTLITAFFGVVTIVSFIQNWSSSIIFGIIFILLLALKGFFYIYKKILMLSSNHPTFKM